MDSTAVVSLSDLERETKQLLESIAPNKPKRPVRQPSTSTICAKSNKRKTGKIRRLGSRSSKVVDLPTDKTLDLYSFKSWTNKLSLEVLDTDPPDESPRKRLTKKQEALMNEREVLLEDQRRIRTAELQFRNQDFRTEQIRILSRTDIFVPGPGISVEDLSNERTRLVNLEHSGRLMMQTHQEEKSTRLEVLRHQRAVILIQSCFRGFIGRKKAILIRRLKDINEATGDWIEVRDRQRGDVWYYNRVTGVSQWDRPSELEDRITPKSNVRKLPQVPANAAPRQKSPLRPSSSDGPQKDDFSKNGLSAVKFAADQVSAALLREAEAVKEVETILGLKYLQPEENLVAPDGSFKQPYLRETIRDALMETRFDSVSVLIADMDRIDNQSTHVRDFFTSRHRIDRSRKSFVSVLMPLKKHSSKLNSELIVDTPDQNEATRNLTLREIKHPGIEGEIEVATDGTTMCFGCWSAGKINSCTLHSDGRKVMASETMLLCRNWELAVLKRRYRSEEIQEIFLQKAASLKYDIRRKKFLTVVEQRHPVYRTLHSLIRGCNQKSILWVRTLHWARSLVSILHSGHVNLPKAILLGERMRQKRTLRNHSFVERFKVQNRTQFPLAPVTGLSWNERKGIETIIKFHMDPVLSTEVQVIHILPYPVPVKLYEPRVYQISLPKTIPMPESSSVLLKASENWSVRNDMMSQSDPASWVERMSKSVAKDCLEFASAQIRAITPASIDGNLQKINEPNVTTIKFATLGRKPRPELKDVGGLPVELLISQLITTLIPPQYGNLIVMEKTPVAPRHSPEITISFVSLAMEPVNPPYVYRPLEHILNYRRPPTISISSSPGIDPKYHYGLNRPEQTGEMESNGFRTTEVSDALPIPQSTTPSMFTPTSDIVSLNDPRANQAITTKEPGQYLLDMRTDLPMGSLQVSVYRSWGFTQRDIYEEFMSDDGVPYWYHRKTGQTFWERPLHDEEKGSPLLGASKIDESHDEEPTVSHSSQDGTIRRVDQGAFRKQILTKHETEVDAYRRRKRAIESLQVAKESGKKLMQLASNAAIAPDKGGGSDPSIKSLDEEKPMDDSHKKLVTAHQILPNGSGFPGNGGGSEMANLLHSETLLSVTRNIDQIISSPAFKEASPQDMVRLGLGMGLAIIQSQQGILNAENYSPYEFEENFSVNVESEKSDHEVDRTKHSIGISESKPLGLKKNLKLEHVEESVHLSMTTKQLDTKLSSMENAQGVQIFKNEGEIMEISSFSTPVNADEAMKDVLPLLVHPELSTLPPDGTPNKAITHGLVSAEGVSSVRGNNNSVRFSSDDARLRESSGSFAGGFYEAIRSKHIAHQDTPYLPHIPNLPQTHVVGRVKPKSAIVDWLALNFDPWSAGRSPLSTIFIENLATQAGKLFDGEDEQIEKEIEKVRGEVTKDSYISVEDKEGIEQSRAVTSKANILAADFKKICSLARHGKYEEVENMMNQSDWEVPINYTDEQGRTLLHVVCQNGNKRLAKLCLRRGIKINAQTLTGQTALHYAFGYGFASLGEYLISKGADDSIRNSEGLTCYEGLESKHITYL